MTENEKNKIIELRNLGYGYQKIANEVGMSVNSIRNFCSKASLANTCKNCGKKISSILGKKKKEFCCDKCRFSWWNKHRDEMNHKVKNVVTCKTCGNEFIVFANSKRVFCSIECYNNHRCKGGNSNG